MSKNEHKNTNSNLLMLGFALLLPGMFLATVLDGGRFFQIIGLILIIVASVVFGASIGARTNRKS